MKWYLFLFKRLNGEMTRHYFLCWGEAEAKKRANEWAESNDFPLYKMV